MVAGYLGSLAEIIDRIPSDRRLVIAGSLGGGSKNQILDTLSRLNESEGDILCLFNSVGGNYYAGIELYETFQSNQNRIIGLVEEKAKSAAFMALQGCALRLAKKDARLHIHNPEFYNLLYPIRYDTTLTEWLHHSQKVYEANHDQVVKVREEALEILLARNPAMDRSELESFLKTAPEIDPVEALTRGFLDGVTD